MKEPSTYDLKQIERIDQFLSQEMPTSGSETATVSEEVEDNDRIIQKDQQIQHLKDQLRIEKERNRSLRNQMKVLRSRKT